MLVVGLNTTVPKDNKQVDGVTAEMLEKCWNHIAVVDDPKMTEIAAFNEAEHVLALHNDWKIWDETAIHELGAGHPFLQNYLPSA